jgi:hypothetical protein
MGKVPILALIGGSAAAMLLIGVGWGLHGVFRAPAVMVTSAFPPPRAAWKYPGWEYKRDKYRNVAIFHFVDGEGTEFSGVCDIGPIFMLTGGNYPSGSETFDLTIDDRTWTLRVFKGRHGRGLPIDDPTFADRFARARNRITIRVGAWNRALKPAPELAWFVEQCRSMRKRDPGAIGKGSEF